jgi:hypothetical protein
LRIRDEETVVGGSADHDLVLFSGVGTIHRDVTASG